MEKVATAGNPHLGLQYEKSTFNFDMTKSPYSILTHQFNDDVWPFTGSKERLIGVHELSRTTVLTSAVNLYKIRGSYPRHQILHLTEHIDHQREIAGVQSGLDSTG